MTHLDDPTAAELFELSGGALCLDFANTWGNHSDPGTDRLLDYERLLAFASQTRSLSERQIVELSGAAGQKLELANAAHALGRELRHVIYRVFSSQAGGRAIPPEDVERINALIGEALSHRRLERRNGDFVWSWSALNAEDLRAPIWPIVESAATLLTSCDFDRVRECNAEDCNWLFLDRSRTGTRRWCSMKSCGNRAKARRYYRRKQTG